MKPQRTDYPDYFENYIPLVKQETVLEALRETQQETLDFINSIDPALENFAYAEGKWTLKEVLIHCIDTERIFSTRALSYARGETQKAISYDENVYVAHSNAGARTLLDIAEEFNLVRSATLFMFKSFSEEALRAKGELPAGVTTTKAIGFTMCGHTIHHLQIIKERYLKQ